MADINLMLEAERRGILPEDKKPLLQEARKRGLVPAQGSYTPPNEPGLEPLLPTDVLNKAATFGADKLREATSKSSLPVRLAGQAGGLGMDIASGFAPSTPGDLALIMGAGPVAREAAPVAKKVLPVMGDWLADFAGAWTGKDPEYIKEVFKTPGIMKKVGQVIGTDVQKHLTDVINSGKQKLGAAIGALQDSFAQFGEIAPKFGKAPPVVKTSEALNLVAQSLERMGHRIPTEVGGRNIPMKIPLFKPEDPEYKMIIGFMKDMKKDLDFGEALNLKRRMDRAIDYGIEGSNGLQRVRGAANTAIVKIRRALSNVMGESLAPADKKEWKLANKAYERGSQAFEELRKQVVGSSPVQTAFRMARNLRNRTVDDQYSRASKISNSVMKELEEVKDRVVAAQFKRRFSGMTASNFLPSSPRLVGQTSAMMGRAFPAVGSNPTLDAFVVNALRQRQGNQ